MLVLLEEPYEVLAEQCIGWLIPWVHFQPQSTQFGHHRHAFLAAGIRRYSVLSIYCPDSRLAGWLGHLLGEPSYATQSLPFHTVLKEEWVEEGLDFPPSIIRFGLEGSNHGIGDYDVNQA